MMAGPSLGLRAALEAVARRCPELRMDPVLVWRMRDGVAPVSPWRGIFLATHYVLILVGGRRTLTLSAFAPASGQVLLLWH